MTNDYRMLLSGQCMSKSGWELESVLGKPYPNYTAEFSAGVIPLFLVNSYDTKRNIVFQLFILGCAIIAG